MSKPPPPYEQGYPQPGGMPQPGGYPPQQGGYPPQQGGYPPPGGYPPQPGVGFAPGAPQPGYGPPPPPGAQSEWMAIPRGVPNCPPGLEYLTNVDQLLVKQKVELLEAFTGFETNNKYLVLNSMGQKVYYAVEDTSCLVRCCCGPMRPFDMKILDNAQNEIIHLYRPLACSSCWCPCCLQTLEVYAPPGNLVGTVNQEWSICAPRFTIRNASGDRILRIEGPICTFSICGDVEFQVFTPDGKIEMGKISKQWTGLVKEAFTDADNFGITFPLDLDASMKAVMLGACFLIDFMFFEKSGNQERDRPGMF